MSFYFYFIFFICSEFCHTLKWISHAICLFNWFFFLMIIWLSNFFNVIFYCHLFLNQFEYNLNTYHLENTEESMYKSWCYYIWIKLASSVTYLVQEIASRKPNILEQMCEVWPPVNLKLSIIKNRCEILSVPLQPFRLLTHILLPILFKQTISPRSKYSGIVCSTNLAKKYQSLSHQNTVW